MRARAVFISIDFNLEPVKGKGGSVRPKRGRSNKKPVQVKMNSNNHREELGSWLWGAADILRGAVRAEDYQDFMLPLLFFKRLSDEYRATYDEKLAEFGNEAVARDPMFYDYEVPVGCFWEDVRATGVNVGSKLNDVLAEVARANQDIDRVINRTDFNNPNEIPEERLVRLIEHFSQRNLANRYVTPDMLGDAYEYLLKKFNEEAPKRAGEFYTPRARSGKDSLKPYQQKTQQLIRDKLVLKEIDTTLPTLTIGPEYLRELENEELSTEEEIMELRQALTVHIRLNLHSLKFFETLSQRIERILRLKDPEQMKLDLRQLVDDINNMEAEMKAKGLTRVEYALLLSAQDALKAPEPELIAFIKDLMAKLEPQTFPGWDLKGDTFRQVQRTIFENLHEQYGKQVGDAKQLLDLRDEFIKWIQRHGTTR